MLRPLFALAALGLVLLPDPGFAAGGVRAFPAAGFRAPLIIKRVPRAGLLQPVRRHLVMPPVHARHAAGIPGFGPRFARHGIGPVAHGLNHDFGRRTLAHSRAHLARRHHRIYHSGWIFPATIGEDVAFIGTPYDPAEAIPVYAPIYAPGPEGENADPPVRPLLPRLSQENQDACRSERVTVPASGGEGERDIVILRC